MVVDPQALFAEIDELARLGIDVGDRLLVSDKAHLILPYHRELDLLSEARRGERKIGTTSRGIGPAYEDKIARRGIRVGDLGERRRRSADAVRDNVAARNRLDQRLDDGLAAGARRAAARLASGMRRWVADVSLFLDAARRAAGQAIMFEGAQGTLLDIDHGTYPYVTSSNATIGGVCTGLGVGPRAIDGVLGVAKAYTTRVGEGPLPTELTGEMGEPAARERAGVRRRRPGGRGAAAGTTPWPCATRVRVNGLDALALTKLDVLDGLPELQVCTAYRCRGATLTEMPGDIAQLAACEPVYETMPAGRRRPQGVRKLTTTCRARRARYIARLEEVTGVPAAIISTGSGARRHDSARGC